MYMREMGTVELLTREGEISIAKRIEEGIRDVLNSIAYWPNAVEVVLKNIMIFNWRTPSCRYLIWLFRP